MLGSASVRLRVAAPSGGMLSLDGCVPTDGKLRWGLVPVVGLLRPGEGQSSEERELRGGQRRDESLKTESSEKLRRNIVYDLIFLLLLMTQESDFLFISVC